MRTQKKYLLLVVPVVLVSALSVLFLPELNIELADKGTPVDVGMLNGINMSYMVGDIALPNKKITEKENTKIVSARLTLWDSFVISSPEPKATEDGKIQIDWTILPASVVRKIARFDKKLSMKLSEILKNVEQIEGVGFGRIKEFRVPKESPYWKITKVDNIYAINLFDFTDEWKGEYKKKMKSALSSGVKAVLEQAGKNNNHIVAFPAIAAARYVVEHDLVISYQDSFSSILGGIARAKGDVPEDVVFVIWEGLRGHQEYLEAISGLSDSLSLHLPSWRSQIANVISFSISICFISGLIYSRHQNAKHSLRSLIGSAIIFIPVVTGAWFTTAFAKLDAVALYPQASIAALGTASVLIGYFAHLLNLFENKLTSA